MTNQLAEDLKFIGKYPTAAVQMGLKGTDAKTKSVISAFMKGLRKNLETGIVNSSEKKTKKIKFSKVEIFENLIQEISSDIRNWKKRMENERVQPTLEFLPDDLSRLNFDQLKACLIQLKEVCS
jgi:hypothetical protein